MSAFDAGSVAAVMPAVVAIVPVATAFAAMSAAAMFAAVVS